MSKLRILLIDDEKDFTEVLKLALESTSDYSVKIENNPLQAVSTALRFQPDLILLDIIMPDYEGPDVLNLIRQQECLQTIPVVFLTATVTRKEVEFHQGIIGGHPFVAKPSPMRDLLEAIEQAT